MKKFFGMLGINLICISTLIYFSVKDENFLSNNILFIIVLIILIIVNILSFINQYLLDRICCRGHAVKKSVDHHINNKNPKNKSSNDELLDLITEYNKNNKSGEQK